MGVLAAAALLRGASLGVLGFYVVRECFGVYEGADFIVRAKAA